MALPDSVAASRHTRSSAAMTRTAPSAHPRPLDTGTEAHHRSAASAHHRTHPGECFPWTASTPRSMSLTALSAPAHGARLAHAPMPGHRPALRLGKPSSSAHSSAFPPHEPVPTAVWAGGHASMHRHTLPSSAQMADSAPLMRPSACAEPITARKGRSGGHALALPSKGWQVSHDGRITVRLPPLSVGRNPPPAALPPAYSAKPKKGGRLAP